MSATQQGEHLVNFVTVGVTVLTLFKYKGRTTLRHVPTDYVNFDNFLSELQTLYIGIPLSMSDLR